MMVEVAEMVVGWPYDAIKANWEQNQQKWQKVTEAFYYDQLGCLPPLDHINNQFLVGECYDVDEVDAYYCGIVCINDIYLAKFCHRKYFQRDIDALRKHIEKENSAIYNPVVKRTRLHVTLAVDVQYEADQDPYEIISKCNYSFAIEPDEGKETPLIFNTEILEVDFVGPIS